MRVSLHQLHAVSVAETLTGKPGVVDLWYRYCDSIDEAERLATLTLLTVEERQRHGAFRFERDRDLFLATRALVRTVLSQYAPVRPQDWRFDVEKHGKPRISAPKVVPTIHFNLANTHGLVVCAVSIAHGLVGIDAERTDRIAEARGLAKRYFAPFETRDVLSLAGRDQQCRFFAYWTLKESYVKARGLGLNLSLDKFGFVIGASAVEFVCPDEPMGGAGWRFALIDAPPPYQIALGADTGGADLSLRASSAGACGYTP